MLAPFQIYGKDSHLFHISTKLNAAAKSLQSCPTLCDPIDIWQPTRFPRPWDSPGKNTGVGCHFLLQCMKVKSESEVTQLCLTLRDPMDCVAHQALLSMGFSRQEYWSGVPLPSPTKLHSITLLSTELPVQIIAGFNNRILGSLHYLILPLFLQL